jgi:hypothetical protein
MVYHPDLNVFFYVFQDEVIVEKCCLLGHLHFIEPTHGLLSCDPGTTGIPKMQLVLDTLWYIVAAK